MRKEKTFRDKTIDKFYSLPLSTRRIVVSNFLYENNDFHSNGEVCIDYDDFISLDAFASGYHNMPREFFNLSSDLEKLFFDFLEKNMFLMQKV